MKKHILCLILIATFIAVLIGGIIYVKSKTPIKTDYEEENFSGYNKLMIIAHPDDDMIWGGTALIKDDYVVVCITCGVNKTRVKEFETVMEETNDKYIMLGYPDKTNGQKDNWNLVRQSIHEDLEKIINLKDWEIIVTHNPEGEYGHIHHKMTSHMVTESANHSKLYYFGKYYTKRSMASLETPLPNRIDDELLNKKIEILKMYESQSFIMTMFDQMFPYENWLSYDEWQVLYAEEN